MSTSVGKRARPKPLVPGKAVEIDELTLAELLDAQRQVAAAKRQLTNVTRRLERQLGDAEMGTIAGRVVIRREQQRTGGHYVRTNWRDDIRIARPGDRHPVPVNAEPDRGPRSHLRLAGGDMP